MKAVLDEMVFTEGKIVARVGFYFSVGEAGYDECYRDILDVDGIPTGKKKLYPFLTLPFDIPVTTTAPIFTSIITDRLNAFKEAHTRIASIQNWVGHEIEV